MAAVSERMDKELKPGQRPPRRTLACDKANRHGCGSNTVKADYVEQIVVDYVLAALEHTDIATARARRAGGDAHQLVASIETDEQFLADLARDLGEKPELRSQLEAFKHEVFDSPRIRSLAESTWETARAALVQMLEDPESELRLRMVSALQDFGRRLLDDSTLQFKIDLWVMQVVEHLVRNYRHDLASIVSDTVQKWDAQEAAEKIELQVGKDLQFIRINGTVVGSLAGLAIYTIATLFITPFAS